VSPFPSQCVDEFSGEERSKVLWTEVVHQIAQLPHDQVREEKLAVLAGISTFLAHPYDVKSSLAWIAIFGRELTSSPSSPFRPSGSSQDRTTPSQLRRTLQDTRKSVPTRLQRFRTREAARLTPSIVRSSSPSVPRPSTVFFRKQAEEYFSRKEYDVTTATCEMAGETSVSSSSHRYG